jgi:hypothetical protein
MYLKKSSVVFVGIFVFLVLVTSAMAGDISGKWIIPGPNNFTVTLVLKVDGSALTGTLSTRPADALDTKDGKIKGDKISFYVERMTHQKTSKIRFKGTVVGDVINLTRDADGTKTDMTARRERPNLPAGSPDSSSKI